jgi:hypothetical protein
MLGNRLGVLIIITVPITVFFCQQAVPSIAKPFQSKYVSYLLMYCSAWSINKVSQIDCKLLLLNLLSIYLLLSYEMCQIHL